MSRGDRLQLRRRCRPHCALKSKMLARRVQRTSKQVKIVAVGLRNSRYASASNEVEAQVIRHMYILPRSYGE